MAVSLRIERVTKRFGADVAVDRADFEVAPGEIFFLLGPSGCGKTTLLRCIAGFCEPDEGRILIGDEDVTHVPPHKRDTGMVFQNYALWPHMTLAGNVGFGLEMRGVSKREAAERVRDALRMVRMEDRADARPNELSGGQQQRIALARALVIRPRCLLLDEPLSNLDAKLRLEMRSEIRRICKQAGLTAVYVTHDQKEALSVADRLAVMDGGRICQTGAPMDVYRTPATTFVARFIGETNILEGRFDGGSPCGAKVETPFGEFVSSNPLPAGVGAGDSVWVSFRPEAVRILRRDERPGDGCVNLLSGTVCESVYLGETAQHLVEIEPVAGQGGGTGQVRVFELNPRDVVCGGSVPARISVDPSDVVMLAK
ncbi:MAG: ABC transporter ATP-binding protein [Lentisphaerae bacterium]|nr:ABC transporter ATP-binding protein [Lentisphaerota bacterium]